MTETTPTDGEITALEEQITRLENTCVRLARDVEAETERADLLQADLQTAREKVRELEAEMEKVRIVTAPDAGVTHTAALWAAHGIAKDALSEPVTNDPNPTPGSEEP